MAGLLGSIAVSKKPDAPLTAISAMTAACLAAAAAAAYVEGVNETALSQRALELLPSVELSRL
jgi:hypothetical protein